MKELNTIIDSYQIALNTLIRRMKEDMNKILEAKVKNGSLIENSIDFSTLTIKKNDTNTTKNS